MKVVGYPRVSTEDQKRFGVSVPDQVEKIIRYCKAHDHDLVDLFPDDGESASNLDRPGLRSALDALDTGRAEGLVVVKLDRLTRRVRDLEKLLDDYFAEKPGKWLLSCGETIDTRTASGRFYLHIQMSVAEWELDSIAERTQAAIDFKQARNERTGSVPYGSRLDESGPRNKRGKPINLLDDPVEIALIARIETLSADGMSARSIAEILNTEDIPTRRENSKWRHSTIRNLLTRGGATSK